MFGRFLKEALLWVQHNIYNNAYTGEITEDQRAGMAKAANKDFTANNFTYYYCEPVGPDTSTPALTTAGAKLYIVRSHLVVADQLVEEARRFAEYVRSGNAYKSATPGSTTTTVSTRAGSDQKKTEDPKAQETTAKSSRSL